MATKKIPMRMCIGCREMKPKMQLIRVVRTPEGDIKLDATGRLNGRGAYICHDAECLKKASRANAVAHAFGTKTPDGLYERLEEELKLIDE